MNKPTYNHSNPLLTNICTFIELCFYNSLTIPYSFNICNVGRYYVIINVTLPNFSHSFEFLAGEYTTHPKATECCYRQERTFPEGIVLHCVCFFFFFFMFAGTLSLERLDGSQPNFHTRWWGGLPPTLLKMGVIASAVWQPSWKNALKFPFWISIANHPCLCCQAKLAEPINAAFLQSVLWAV